MQPGVFWLALLLLPWIWWMGRPRGLAARASSVLRALAILAVLVALARPRHVDRVESLAVVHLLDVSQSLPEEQRREAIRWIQSSFERKGEKDRAALVIFGERPSLERPFTRVAAGDADGVLRIEGIESRIDPLATNLERALLFASRLFPEDAARRIVLSSDGNPTHGDLENALRTLRAEGIALDVRPLDYAFEREVVVEGLHGPARAHLGEPVHLRAVVTSLTPARATLRLSCNGRPLGEARSVQLTAGTQSFRFSPLAGETGPLRYELSLESESDGLAANNVGRATVLVDPEARILLVQKPDADPALADALTAAGLVVERKTPMALGDHPADFIRYSAVILDGLPAWEFDALRLDALEDAVTHLGLGLVVVGGPDTFAAGGYKGTPLERLIPVSLEVARKKRMPKGALVLVLHSIEFDSGNVWANQICRSALGGLEASDEVGLVYFSFQGEKWLFPLARKGNGKEQLELVRKCEVGDMPSLHNCFVLAEQALAKSDAAVKHVIVISDGDPQVPAPDVLARLQNGKVSVSSIQIGAHSPDAATTMKAMAAVGPGRYYVLDGRVNVLPQVILKEASVVKRRSIIEEPFVPLIALPNHPVLRGLGTRWPELQGYALTGPKLGAETLLLANEEEQDPLLAIGYAGIGRVAAFTSSADSRWGKGWVGSEHFATFWPQLVRGCLSSVQQGPFPVRCRTEGTRLLISFEARDDAGRPLDSLLPIARIVTRGSEGRELPLRQVAPGEYRVAAEDLTPGHHLVNLSYEHEGERRAILSGAAVDFAAEQRFLRSDRGLLEHAARSCRGRVLEAPQEAFRHDLEGVKGTREFSHLFLALAAVLCVLDVALRRLEFRPRRRHPRASEQQAPAKERKAVAKPTPKTRRRAQPSAPEREEKPSEASERPARRPPPAESTGGTLDALRKAKEKKAQRREWK